VSEESTRVFSVLAIEDDEDIQRLLEVAFENTKYTLLKATSAGEGIEAVTKNNPDVILLDLALPDKGGLEVIQTIRKWTEIPILVVSGRGDEEVKVAALDAGADDYVTKPFGIAELTARIQVALKHSSRAAENNNAGITQFGVVSIDHLHRDVKVRGESVRLTPIEYRLLTVLTKNEGKVVTHRKLLSEVWGEEYTDEAQYLRVYIGYLRRKVELNPDHPEVILNEPRVGYRLGSP